MSEAGKSQVDDPFGPDDPIQRPVRFAYEMVSSGDEPDSAGAIVELWARLGWTAPESPTATPPLMNDDAGIPGPDSSESGTVLPECPYPSHAPIITPAQVHWQEAIGRRHPGPVLLAAEDAEARVALQTLLRQEIEDAMDLAPTVKNARLTQWAVDRLCGFETLSAEHRKSFLLMTAEIIREVREANATRAISHDKSLAGRATLADVARNASLDTVASQPNSAAIDLAKASRKLTSRFPRLGEALLLAYYGGFTVAEVAGVTGRLEIEIKQELTDAADWVLVQSVSVP
jgi:hypothetical protein